MPIKYWPLTPPPPRSFRTHHDEAAGVLGCAHYQRRCAIVAPCCGRTYTCRICHDAAEDHRLEQQTITDMLCMECGQRQPVAGKPSSLRPLTLDPTQILDNTIEMLEPQNLHPKKRMQTILHRHAQYGVQPLPAPRG